MASKFKIWVDDNHLDNVMSYSAFESDSQRTAGFTGGTPASSIRVNSAIRQANLIACALMELADPTGTADFRSSVSSIQTLLSTYLTTKLKVANAVLADKATNADVTNLNTSANAVVNFKIGNGTAYNKTINNVAQATNATNATNVNVTNKNTGDNAIVNFQLGSGTAYNKTINNVANATNAGNANTLQNVDMSADTVPTFGNYTTKKRKLLWDGSEYVTYSPTQNTGTTKTITFTTPASEGAKLEIIVFGTPVTATANGNAQSKFFYEFNAINDSRVILFFANINWTPTTTQLTFSFKQLALQLSLTSNTNVTNHRESAAAALGVTKVYEVLE